MAIYGNGIELLRLNTIVNEAFVGKSDTLLQIEEEFNKFRDSKPKMTQPLSTHTNIKNICRLFEKQFGMKIFSFNIDHTDSPNAYTYTLGTRFDIVKNTDFKSAITGDMQRGYRFKEGNEFCVVVHISYGLLTNENITGEELTGIILHEIGHNFADFMYDNIRLDNSAFAEMYYKYLSDLVVKLGILSVCTLGLTLPMYLKAKKLLKDSQNAGRIEEDLKKAKRGRTNNKLRGLIKGLVGKHRDKAAVKNSIQYRMNGKAGIEKYKRVSGELGKTKARESISRQNEVFADKFAGVYGYGPAIARGLSKLDKMDKASETMQKAGGKLKEADDEYTKATLDINDYDCHPQLIQRLMEEIKLLEREYAKDDVDPKLKAVIEDQLNQLYELLKELTDTNKKISTSEDARIAYNEYMKNKCPDSVSDEIEDAIEDALDKHLEKSSKRSDSASK